MERKLLDQGLLLEYITLEWNVVGCIILGIAAYYATSVALIGFSFDSVIEIFASVIVVWQLKATHKNDEKKALHFIGYAFLLLSLYLIVQSSFALAHNIRPKESIAGIIWLVATCIVMFSLAYGKKLVGKKLGHSVLQSEAKVTMVDGVLAAVVLTSLLINLSLDIWWIDAVTGYVIAIYSIQEAVHAWRE